MNTALLILSMISLGLALLPGILFVANWWQYRPAPIPVSSDLHPTGSIPSISILIPARDEEVTIGDCLHSALASHGIDIEVIVLDDHSSDDTPNIVAGIARNDPRVHLASAPPLPAGWCGKQHACWNLTKLARRDLFAFIDADVRLEPDGLASAVAFLLASGSGLVSGIPRQEAVTFLERLEIPLIHFILLGYLPIGAMRNSPSPAFGAGCGQLFLATRAAYEITGGHAAIRQSLHDGLTLPRAFRKAGISTDLFDATDTAHCRMYRSSVDVFRGLAKNAVEGMASPRAIIPWTFLLFGGQILPIFLLMTDFFGHGRFPSAIILPTSIASLAISYGIRFASAKRFRQSKLGALLHPLGIALLLLIQWYALLRHFVGRPAPWRGRVYR